MQTNALPHYDDSDNATGCCPRFNPDGWDGQDLHFRDKPFLRATTRSAMHIPLNMGRVFTRVSERVEDSGGWDPDDMIILSRDTSPWEGEHFFAVPHDVPGEEMTTLTGDYLTRVFEGPYRKVKDWIGDLEQMARDQGHDPKGTLFFYTTCPRCAKAYGENYVVGLVEI